VPHSRNTSVIGFLDDQRRLQGSMTASTGASFQRVVAFIFH
jgi:hypothetical protein